MWTDHEAAMARLCGWLRSSVLPCWCLRASSLERAREPESVEKRWLVRCLSWPRLCAGRNVPVFRIIFILAAV